MQGSSPGSMPHQPGVRASLHYGIYNPRPGHHTRCHCRRGVVVVIYVGQLGYATCLTASDGFGGSGNARSSFAAASPYPALSSPEMASSFHISRPAQTCRLPCRFGRPCALPDIEPVGRRTRRRRAGVFPIHALASSPQFLASAYCNAACDTLSSQSWHLSLAMRLRPHLHCAGTLPALRWHCCSRRAGVPASIWLHRPSCAGLFPLVMLLATHCHC